MRYGAAYMLAALSGEVPTAKTIENILGSVGIDCDAKKAELVVEAFSGKDIDELIAEGMTKMSGLMSGGGGSGGGAAAASGDAPAAEETKAEEKKVEEEEESDDDMGFGLFD